MLKRKSMMKKLRMTIDIAMTVVLIGLMAYSLIGELTHEILRNRSSFSSWITWRLWDCSFSADIILEKH